MSGLLLGIVLSVLLLLLFTAIEFSPGGSSHKTGNVVKIKVILRRFRVTSVASKSNKF